MTRPRYIIKFTGLFESGFVKFAIFHNESERPLSGIIEGHKWATKFRWRWVANFYCRVMNAGDDKLRTYRVEEAIENVPRPTNK